MTRRPLPRSERPFNVVVAHMSDAMAAVSAVLSDTLNCDDAEDTAQTLCFDRAFRRLFARETDPSPQVGDVEGAVSEILDRLEAGIGTLELSELLNARDAIDPVTALYEAVLHARAPERRKRHGVWGTPEPVAGYIVRSVDELLKDACGVSAGLSAPDTHVLDPAAGTGVFLNTALARMAETCGAQTGGAETGGGGHLYGFELLRPALAVSHANLARHANPPVTLLQADALQDPRMDAPDVRTVKCDVPITAIIGNPPYLGRSANWGAWIRALVRGHDTYSDAPCADYLSFDGKPLGERNPKWLGDDYVKFIRFAQWRIERTGFGVIGFVTNHGFLDSPTFRGMRESLTFAFDTLHVLDLHGNANRREKTPDGGRDDNVFAIRQGVSVIFMTRRKSHKDVKGTVYHADLWGRRREAGDGRASKFSWLDSHTVSNTKWSQVKVPNPSYVFTPRSAKPAPEYDGGWSVADIFPVRSLGIATARDRLAVRFTRDEMAHTAGHFAAMDEASARAHFAVGRDGADWTVCRAQEDLRAHPDAAADPVRLLYRPFDVRWTVYTGVSRGFHCRPRDAVMRHVVNRDNLCLLFSRSVEIARGWEHAFVTRMAAQLHTVSIKEVNTIAPLYVYDASTNERRVNLDPRFLTLFTDLVSTQRDQVKNNIDTERSVSIRCFYYIYAVLSSMSYRETYQQQLVSEPPRIPIPAKCDVFDDLARIGERLVALHTLSANTSWPVLSAVTAHPVSCVTYSSARQYIDLGDAGYLTEVPQVAWDFHVGGYRVAERWLKDRKGRSLTPEDVSAYRALIAAIVESVTISKHIDGILRYHGGFENACVGKRV